MTKNEAIKMARDNALTAIDQANDYTSLNEAFDSYFDNVRDTLTENGVTEYDIIVAAEYAFETVRKTGK
jgi:hypothetical protein